MSRRLLPLFITAAMFLAITIPSRAKSSSNGSISVTITLTEKGNNREYYDPRPRRIQSYRRGE